MSGAVVVTGHQLLPAEAAWGKSNACSGVNRAQAPRQTDGAFGNRSVQTPAIATILAANNARTLIAVARRQTVDEEIRRLKNVVVGGDDSVLHTRDHI